MKTTFTLVDTRATRAFAASMSRLADEPDHTFPYQDRWLNHVLVLGRYGVTDLKQLGPLLLAGNVLMQGGVVVPEPDVLGDLMPFQAAQRVRPCTCRQKARTIVLESIGGMAHTLNGLKHTKPPLSGRSHTLGERQDLIREHHLPPIPLSLAYLAGDELTWADGATFILSSFVKHLTIIARKLVIGKDVTFTW